MIIWVGLKYMATRAYKCHHFKGGWRRQLSKKTKEIIRKYQVGISINYSWQIPHLMLFETNKAIWFWPLPQPKKKPYQPGLTYQCHINFMYALGLLLIFLSCLSKQKLFFAQPRHSACLCFSCSGRREGPHLFPPLFLLLSLWIFLLLLLLT
jgi:hypothetical protein